MTNIILRSKTQYTITDGKLVVFLVFGGFKNELARV
jgi:hypothetical protein